MKQSLRLTGLLVLVLVLLCPAAGGSAVAVGNRVGPDVELGEAPRRDVSQEVVGLPPLLMRAMPFVSRDAVVALYNTVYGPGDLVTLTWTGSVTGCNPGTTNLAHQQAVIDRVNYFRSLVGLPSVTLLGGTPTTQAQAAALMMSANNALSHYPPLSWVCYSSEGATGASKSNIALGLNGVDAIDLYMDDPGAGNTAAGHRRWIFYPPQASIGTGDVDRTSTANPANDLYVFAPWATRPATPLGIAWPPAGYVPYQNLPSASNRWSFSYPGADFAAGSVTMSGPSGALPVTLETVATGYGDNTIVFRPTGVSYTQPLADTTYTVTVSGISGSEVPVSFQYTVTVIDPVVASKPACTVTVIPARLSAAGGNADVAASCTNSPTSYAWTANGTALSSVTTEVFTYAAAANSTTSAQTIMFQVIASNSAGSSSPATATLTIAKKSGTPLPWLQLLLGD